MSMIPFSTKFITVIEHTRAGYGCPNCGSYHQHFYHELGSYLVDIKCVDCKVKINNINPNQPYGKPHPHIQIDMGYHEYEIMTAKHGQVVKAKKQVIIYKKRKAVADAIRLLLTKI